MLSALTHFWREGCEVEESEAGMSAQRVDEKLAKVLTLWRGASTDGERQAARARGEVLARNAGMTFQAAVAADAAERARVSGGPRGIFDGFDDFMEACEPGYKAARAQNRAEKLKARIARKAALIERHGSLESALAPCEREAKIIEAVAQWRKPCDPPHERWTT
jgi:hypothetical protein